MNKAVAAELKELRKIKKAYDRLQIVQRQLLWPVNDNYFGRLPLSFAACS